MTSATVTPEPAACGTLKHPGLTVVLRLEAAGQIIGREAVTGADLTDAADETLLTACFQKGLLDRTVADLDLRVFPVTSPRDASRLTGFALEAAAPLSGGIVAREEFTLYALQDVARRIESRLREAGVLKEGELFYFGLELDPDAAGSSPAPEAVGMPALDVRVCNPPIHFLHTPVASLLEQARMVGERRAGAFPVFYTEEVFAKAEQFSRKGAGQTPRRESGALLAGQLGSCPESGAFFAVVTDAFEMQDTEATLISLELSGRSWVQFRAMLKARQSVEPATRLLGQAHGHPFPPGDPCEACAHAEVCSKTNVYPSADDRHWMRAVFARAAWSLCHIFGSSARGDLVNGLFGRHDGRLLERHFHVLPEFDSANDPVLTIPQ